MLRYALELGTPAAVRFPRGCAASLEGVGLEPVTAGRGEVVRPGGDVALIALGDMVEKALLAAGILAGQGVSALVVNARFAKPLDGEFLEQVAKGKKLVVTLEDNVLAGGFGSGVLGVLNERSVGVPVLMKGLPDSYVEHGKIPELMDEVGLTAERIAAEVSGRLDSL
jgi:1-deoxy-D-xylulose-5-phosphate synthase